MKILILTIVIIALFILINQYKKINSNFIDSTIDFSTFFFDGLEKMKNSKRKIWMHIPNNYNSRIWESFGSRSSTYLNMNYQILCIKSVIDCCNKNYEIILFNDNDINKLLPKEKPIEFEKISGELLDIYRNVSFLKILYLYGGVFLPPCFFMKKNINTIDRDNLFYVSEIVNQGINVSMNTCIHSIEIMGSNKKNPILSDYIDKYVNKCLKDFTQNNISFSSNLLKEYDIPFIDGKVLGTKDKENKPIYLEDLMENKNIILDKSNIGLYIPNNELKKRTNYNWFINLSIREILETNIFISKYIVENQYYN